eukprot:gene7535-7745_t
MSTPHVAGITALLKQRHGPTWSPMAIKSALMTTAYQTTKTGPNPGQVFGTPFDFGAGHVNPRAALQPGLVVDSNVDDWFRFMCGVEPDFAAGATCQECVSNPALCNPRDMNTPSVTVTKLAGVANVTRTLTSVLSEMAEFTASSIINPPGFQITLIPVSFSLAPGDSITVQISIKNVGEGGQYVFDQYKDGSITWTSSGSGGIATTVRIPVVVKATLMDIPKQVKFANRVAKAATWRHIRIAIFDEDYQPGTDLNLFLVNGRGEFIDISNKVGSNDEVNIVNKDLAKVTLYVTGWNVPSGTTAFKLYIWTLTQSTPTSSNTVWTPAASRPDKVLSAGSLVNISITLSSKLLSPSQKWLGAAFYDIQKDDGTPQAPVSMILPSPTLIYLP